MWEKNGTSGLLDMSQGASGQLEAIERNFMVKVVDGIEIETYCSFLP